MHFLLAIIMMFGYVPAQTYMPCKVETDSNCHWNGARSGNGHGSSFVDIHDVPNFYRYYQASH